MYWKKKALKHDKHAACSNLQSNQGFANSQSVFHRALIIVGSMGSFEPMNFWKLFHFNYYYSQKKGFKTPNILRYSETSNPSTGIYCKGLVSSLTLVFITLKVM